MKKIFALMCLMVALVSLPSCNEDATINDAYLTSQLPGVWQMNHTTTDFIQSESYYFQTQSRFRYSYSYTDMHEATMKSWSVSGAWNVMKGVLQLSYDMDTFRYEGYSEKAIDPIKQDLLEHNLGLKEMNEKNRPYGNAIEFKTIDGRTVLIMDGVNGYFERMSAL